MPCHACNAVIPEERHSSKLSPQQHRTLPSATSLVCPDGTILHALLQLTNTVGSDRNPAAEIVEPVDTATIRHLEVIYRARLDAAAEIGVLDVLHIRDVAALEVRLVAVDGVGEGGVVEEVACGFRRVGRGRGVDQGIVVRTGDIHPGRGGRRGGP